ncbi:hypothetical protein [Sorangium sp. So ce131]|uniref:hypothetical protein n=1 Tax=Sorangium sp. So ce131 TaxID=3133282 RepID=UPI003F63F2A3
MLTRRGRLRSAPAHPPEVRSGAAAQRAAGAAGAAGASGRERADALGAQDPSPAPR